MFMTAMEKETELPGSAAITVGQQGLRDADRTSSTRPTLTKVVGDEGLVGVACLDVHHIRARSGIGPGRYRR